MLSAMTPDRRRLERIVMEQSMDTKQILPSDISRCHGDGEWRCGRCARNRQIAIDDNTRWYPYMQPGAMKSMCPYFISCGDGDPIEENLQVRPNA